jgi:hypothetical protein
MSEQQSVIPAMPVPEGREVQENQPSPSNVSAGARTQSWPVEALKWMFSFPVMLGTCLVAKLFYELRGFQVDPDVWWHIRVGQDILRTHTWPTSDPYSYTVHGMPWLAYEWLGDVVLALVAKHGLQALAAFLFIMGGLVAIAIYYYASLSSGSSKAGVVAATLASIFAVGNFNLRPQMWGALFIAITLIVLEKFRRGHSKALWVLPPMFLLWINAHGSWVIGIGIILVTLLGGFFEFRVGDIEGVRWSEKQRMQLELALLGALAMLPITPYGTELATYPFLVGSSLPLNLHYVVEWFPMPFDIWWGKAFLAVVVGALALQTMYHFTWRIQQSVLAIGAVVMTCIHVRFVIIFAPFFAPIVATMLARWLDKYRREKDKYVLNFAIMAAVVFAMVWYFPSSSDLEHKLEAQFPVRAVNFLRSHPVPGLMFNNYGFGGYLVKNFPEQRVFLDGRGELYELGGVFAEYMQISGLKPAGFPLLKSYGIRLCLLENGEPLTVALSAQPDWKRIYTDDKSVILVRRDSAERVVSTSGQLSAAERSEHESSAN